jgi:hypothetical protein
MSNSAHRRVALVQVAGKRRPWGFSTDTKASQNAPNSARCKVRRSDDALNNTPMYGRAAALTIAAALIGGALLLVSFGAVRYNGSLVINLGALALLTFALAVPGAVLVVVAAIVDSRAGRVGPWTCASITGSVFACAGAVLLALAADCLPYCKSGRGSLVLGIALAVPAGFSAGAIVFALWSWSKEWIGLTPPQSGAPRRNPIQCLTESPEKR